MKIISWNCNGNFRETITTIIDKDSKTYLDADIYVIVECENPKEPLPKYKKYKKIVEELVGDKYFWKGYLHYMGLGIFAKDNIKLEPIKGLDERFKNFIAVRVNDSFNLLAVLAMGADKEKGLNPYVGMIHDYFDVNSELYDENLIIAETSRLIKLRHFLRQYLFWIENSVFEGEVSETEFNVSMMIWRK